MMVARSIDFFLNAFFRIIQTFSVFHIIVLVAFATDYLSGDYHYAGVVEVQDGLFPIVWGVALSLAAILIIRGLMTSNYRCVATGNVVGWVAFTMFFATSTWNVINLSPWDDWRLAAINLFIALSMAFTSFLAIIADDLCKEEGCGRE